MKRAQATIFIILGIVLVIAIFIVYQARDQIFKSQWGLEKQRDVAVQLEIKDIETYVDGCVKDVAEGGIRLIGLQGGYMVPPPNSLETDFSTISYGYYNGKKSLPSIEQMQEEFALYVESSLPLCFDESDFPDFDIATGDINARSRIKQNSVSVTVNYPISVSKDSANYRIRSKYSKEIPVRLGKIYDVVSEIIDNEASNPGAIDLTYLTDLDYDIAILPYSDDLFVYSITDPNSKINDIPYTFMFASRLR